MLHPITKRMFLHLAVTLCSVLTLSMPSYAAVVFETNFDNVQTWNPSGSAACWQDTIPIEGGSGACGAPAGPLPKLGTSPTIFNDFRLLAPQCSSIPAMHIGSGSDIEAVKSGANFSPFGGTGKSYVHFYEPCMSSSGGWGSDGLLGTYFGKTTGYSELYVQAKVKFQPGFVWTAGSQQKLMHIMHFNEDYDQGVLQAYNMFAYNLPDMVPGIYTNTAYSPNPQFYLHTSHTNGTTDSPSPTPSPAVNVADGNWHTLTFHVKLNSAAGVADGKKEMWLDGNLIASYSNVPYTGSNTPTAAAYGFNRVVFGGNSSNLFGSADGRTQWFSVDELVVSTTSIPVNYVIGGATTTDTAPPTASISSPAGGSTASGTVSVTANVSDNVGVTKVEYYVNGALKATDTSAPYVYSWDTSTVAAGTYTLMTKAYDAAGNVGQSATVSVSVVKDTTIPTVSLTAPANNATVSGTVVITASAADNIGISKVEFYSNGTQLAAGNVAPYSYNWNTTSVANGVYALTVKAYDASNNVVQSAAVSVTVNNVGPDTSAPAVSIASPTANSTVSGNVYAAVSASDNIGVTKVEYYVNGGLDNTLTVAPFSYSVPTTVAHNGSYTMYAKAYDAAGNVKQSATTNFTIYNTVTPVADTTTPTASITSPTANSTVNGTVTIAATATDNIGVSKVEFYVNDSLKGTDTASPYSYSWNTTSVSDGSYAITTKAYDAAGNEKQSSAVNVNVKNTAVVIPPVVADTTAPTVSIASPLAYSTVRGTVKVAVTASDNVGVTKVVYYVNGGVDNTLTVAPFSYSVPTTAAQNGTYTMYAKAYDAAGNMKQSATIKFTIKN